jgi:membrane protein insertase Oxa1/YidC/SpoIIIJ
MPSGLVLYWLVQTGLSLVEQTVVKKMRPLKTIEVEPVKKGPKKS